MIILSILTFSLIIEGALFSNMVVSEKIRVIEAFLDTREPIFPVLFTCWPKNDSRYFIRKLNKKYGGTVWKQHSRTYPQYFIKHHQLFITDLDCINSTTFLEQFKSKTNDYKPSNLILDVRDILEFPFNVLCRSINTPYSWFIIGTRVFDTFTQISPKLRFLPDSNIVLGQYDQNKWDFKDAYKIYYSGKVVFTDYGKWDGKVILDVPKESLAKRRRNLNQTLLRSSIVCLNNDSLNHLTDHKYRGIDPVTKLSYILLQALLDSINASRSYSYLPTWGYSINGTSQYTGLIGELQRNISDIGGTPLFITPDRRPIIEFIAPMYNSKGFFIFRAPPLSFTSNIFTLPFDAIVWVVEILLVMFITVCLFLAMKWENPKLSLADVIMISVGALTQQGSNIQPKRSSGRLIIFILLTTLTFLFVAYSAYIIVMLQSSSNSIQTLHDLLDSDIELGCEDNIYNRYYFTTATEPVRKAIYERKIIRSDGTEKFISLDEGLRKLRNEFYAFHSEGSRLYLELEKTFLQSEKCGLMQIEYLPVTFPWMAIQKHSPYLEILKIELKKIHERGLQSRESRIFILKKPACTGRGIIFSSVNLMDIAGACYLILIGMGLSILEFGVECLIGRFGF